MRALKVSTCLLLAMSLCVGCELIRPIAPVDEDELDMSPDDADMVTEEDARQPDPDMTMDAEIGADADLTDSGLVDMCESAVCPSGQICQGGRCIDVECTVDTVQDDCAAFEQCEDNACVPIMCESGSDCPQGFICSVDAGVCAQGCVTDNDCMGDADLCVDGECVDVRSDERHCGRQGQACATDLGSACIQGFCTCAGQAVSSTTSLSREVFTGMSPLTGMGLLTYPSTSLYRCSDSTQELSSCDTTLVFDEDYASDKPHYIAYGVRVGQTDRLELVTLDGRGVQLATAEIEAPFSSEILLVRTASIEPGVLGIFILYQNSQAIPSTREIASYRVEHKSMGISITRESSSSGDTVWAVGERIVDFSVATRERADGSQIVALPVVSLDGETTTGGTLSLHGAVRSQDQLTPFTGESYALSDVAQLWRGFSAAIVDEMPGEAHVQVITLDGTFHPGLISPEPDPSGFAQMFYNRRVFVVDPGSAQVLRDDARTVSVNDTLIDNFSGFSSNPADPTDISPPMALLETDSQELVALGWSRYIERRGMSRKDKTSHRYVDLGAGGVESATTLLDLNRIGVYDQAYMPGQNTQIAYRVETSVNNGSFSSTSQVKLSTISTGSTPQMGSTREVTPLTAARTVSVARSPHATGVLVQVDETSEATAELYFVVDDDEPVCKPQ